MRIECLNNNFVERNLTIGRKYSVAEELNEYYKRKDDLGNLDFYIKSRFVKVEI